MEAERVKELARLVGIAISEDEVQDVGSRLDSLLREIEKLDTLDLAGIQPATIFPETADRGE